MERMLSVRIPAPTAMSASENRGQGLVLAVAVVVAVVARFGRNAGEDNHHDVGGHVRERVHGIGDHGAASAQDAGGELGGGQQQVGDEADERDAVNLAFAEFS